jgi:hypothetical protein
MNPLGTILYGSKSTVPEDKGDWKFIILNLINKAMCRFGI